jgi:elongation factor 1-gamma
VTVDNLPWEDQEKRAQLKPKIATATFPYLETSQGVLAEANAITQYLAETYNPTLLGSNSFEKAQVRQWIEFANIEVGRNNKALVYPLYGFYEFNKTDADNATKDLKEQLTVLNKYLEGKSFIVGSSMTLADVTMFFTLRSYFMLVFVEDQRKKLYPNVTAWFTSLAASEAAVSAFGRTVLCKVPAKAVKVEKKEEPKKEEKKVEKPAKKEAAEGDDDEEKPKKKKQNPLDLIQSSFVLDDFKKEFLNTTEKAAVMKSFWTKFDPSNYSFWTMQYQKLASEGKILFKTCNSSSFFLQKLDNFRKYTFSVHGVYGVEGNYEVRGLWMWKGTDIPEEVREHDNFAYMTMKKLDSASEADRKMVEDYWLNL